MARGDRSNTGIRDSSAESSTQEHLDRSGGTRALVAVFEAGGTGDVGHGLAVLNPLTTLLPHVEGALFAINLLYDS